MAKNQVNGVSASVASANSKANKLIALDVLKSVKEKKCRTFQNFFRDKNRDLQKRTFRRCKRKANKIITQKVQKCNFQFSFNDCKQCR